MRRIRAALILILQLAVCLLRVIAVERLVLCLPQTHHVLKVRASSSMGASIGSPGGACVTVVVVVIVVVPVFVVVALC